MSISITDEAKRARAKRKRAAVKAARKKRVADAKARDARIERNHFSHILSDNVDDPDDEDDEIIDDSIKEYLKLSPKDQPWTWDSRIKPPEVRQ